MNIPNNVCCRSIFAYDSTGFLARSAKFFSDGVKVSIQTMSESGRQAITKSASLQEVASRGVGLANESKVHEVIFKIITLGAVHKLRLHEGGRGG